jgi:DNA-binding response OmpR family regulator
MTGSRIPIVEDEPAILRGLKDTFVSKGCEVLTPTDGEAGIKLALSAKPGLALLDIMLPRVNGYEICRAIRESGSDVELTVKEFSLLAYFASRPGRALTRNDILNAVWGNSVMVTPRSIDRCVTTLRAKIEPDPHNPKFIRTIRDIGYRFEAWSNRRPR